MNGTSLISLNGRSLEFINAFNKLTGCVIVKEFAGKTYESLKLVNSTEKIEGYGDSEVWAIENDFTSAIIAALDSLDKPNIDVIKVVILRFLSNLQRSVIFESKTVEHNTLMAAIEELRERARVLEKELNTL